jgi:hypothetical protein
VSHIIMKMETNAQGWLGEEAALEQLATLVLGLATLGLGLATLGRGLAGLAARLVSRLPARRRQPARGRAASAVSFSLKVNLFESEVVASKGDEACCRQKGLGLRLKLGLGDFIPMLGITGLGDFTGVLVGSVMWPVTRSRWRSSGFGITDILDFSSALSILMMMGNL